MTQSDRLREQALDGFWETVPSLWNFVRSYIRVTATSNFDVTVEQFHVLRFVRKGMSISELATAKNISRPAISQAVDALVKKGLLTRTQSLNDRRYVELTLTSEGNALLDSVFKETRQWMKERMKKLSATELETIARAMDAMKKMLD
ncbi:MAG: MarR family transcriptional regulator [Anaerolineales bacterium]|uniref:MarR family winged helix-turn-helix transcriptional regulator n=1 Tax=Candidatus Villigracilis proximus TaxID=3140683 RepID=UPI0031351932|nr:MarR family transcriptional regulator [Anaerolineales bacterium]